MARDSESTFANGLGRWGTRTPEQCLASCLANAEEAARLQSRAEAAIRNGRDGGLFEQAPELEKLKADYRRHKAEQMGWRDVANHYREIIAADRERLRAEDARRAAEEAAARAAEEAALTREVGADDIDDGDADAWGDLGFRRAG